jgi:hypothetical protein
LKTKQIISLRFPPIKQSFKPHRHIPVKNILDAEETKQRWNNFFTAKYRSFFIRRWVRSWVSKLEDVGAICRIKGHLSARVTHRNLNNWLDSSSCLTKPQTLFIYSLSIDSSKSTEHSFLTAVVKNKRTLLSLKSLTF